MVETSSYKAVKIDFGTGDSTTIGVGFKAEDFLNWIIKRNGKTTEVAAVDSSFVITDSIGATYQYIPSTGAISVLSEGGGSGSGGSSLPVIKVDTRAGCTIDKTYSELKQILVNGAKENAAKSGESPTDTTDDAILNGGYLRIPVTIVHLIGYIPEETRVVRGIVRNFDLATAISTTNIFIEFVEPVNLNHIDGADWAYQSEVYFIGMNEQTGISNPIIKMISQTVS